MKNLKKGYVFFANIKKYEIRGVIISGVCVGDDQSTDTKDQPTLKNNILNLIEHRK